MGQHWNYWTNSKINNDGHVYIGSTTTPEKSIKRENLLLEFAHKNE